APGSLWTYWLTRSSRSQRSRRSTTPSTRRCDTRSRPTAGHDGAQQPAAGPDVVVMATCAGDQVGGVVQRVQRAPVGPRLPLSLGTAARSYLGLYPPVAFNTRNKGG